MCVWYQGLKFGVEGSGFGFRLQSVYHAPRGYTLKRPGAEDIVVTRLFCSLDRRMTPRKQAWCRTPGLLNS